MTREGSPKEPEATRRGRRRFKRAKWPQWFTPICLSKPSSVTNRSGNIMIPAFNTKASREGSARESNALTKAFTLASEAKSTSMCLSWTLAPASPHISRSADRAPSCLPALRPAKTTCENWPLRARPSTVALPTPPDAPVTIAILRGASSSNSPARLAAIPGVLVGQAVTGRLRPRGWPATSATALVANAAATVSAAVPSRSADRPTPFADRPTPRARAAALWGGRSLTTRTSSTVETKPTSRPAAPLPVCVARAIEESAEAEAMECCNRQQGAMRGRQRVLADMAFSLIIGTGLS
mmetsp:Transcript_87312/g.275767  ORF Transcript_87312/g.275767 Transcript_87312/m.275767 type:complete len:296 (-) Transcript_87312:11-898(-)